MRHPDRLLTPQNGSSRSSRASTRACAAWRSGGSVVNSTQAPWLSKSQRQGSHAASAATAVAAPIAPPTGPPSPRPTPRCPSCGAARAPGTPSSGRRASGPRLPAPGRWRGAVHLLAGRSAETMASGPRRRGQDPLWYKDAIMYETHVNRSSTPTTTASAISAGSSRSSTTCRISASPASGSCRSSRRRCATTATTSPTTRRSTRTTARSTISASSWPPRTRAASGSSIELVVNHTSDQHPWFQRARRAPPGSPERDYYVWSDTDERYREARIIFTDTEKSNWTWDPVAKQYYWHRFFSHQPDLNFDNPAVLQEMLDVLALLARSWRGRVPARRGAVPRRARRGRTARTSPRPTRPQAAAARAGRAVPGAHAARRGEPVARRRAPLLRRRRRVPHGVPLPAHAADLHGAAPRGRQPIVEIMRRTPQIPESCQWALFLRNHDELTLEMVTTTSGTTCTSPTRRIRA